MKRGQILGKKEKNKMCRRDDNIISIKYARMFIIIKYIGIIMLIA